MHACIPHSFSAVLGTLGWCQVMTNGSQSMHAVGEAGVSVTSAAGSELLQLKTWDVSLVSPGSPTPFPNGLFAPQMEEGVHFNLMNNVWGTNYVSTGNCNRVVVRRQLPHPV